MAYPPAPWSLMGHGVQTIHTVPTADVRSLVPPELDIVSVLPGKTLGVIAFAHYGPGSVLEYDELIIAPAVVKRDGQYGVWVSHIYVSDPDSVMGGREIWGVPKRLADFRWENDGQRRIVTASMEGKELCRMTTGRRLPLWTQCVKFPSYSQLSGDLLRFIGDTRSKISLTRAAVEVPPTSPFAEIGFSRPWLAAWLDPMDMVCTSPVRVGKTASVSPLVPLGEPAA